MRILLVEDDQKLNYSIKYQLEKSDFTVDSCFDGEEAVFYVNQKIHDVVLLDRMLPLLNGTEVLHRMRNSNNNVPVILITAMGAVHDKIEGLDSGADDYLVKPFDFDELLARIRCVTRRPHALNKDDSLHFGDITLHIGENRLAGPKSPCTLSKKECMLLEAFFRNHDQTLTRSLLLSKVWGMDSDVEDGNLDNYIHFLRRRLKTTGSSVTLITVRGIGYRLQYTGF